MGPAVQTWQAIAVRTFFDGPEEHSQPHSIFVVLRAVDLQRTGHPRLSSTAAVPRILFAAGAQQHR
jgi:hypothetical protein